MCVALVVTPIVVMTDLGGFSSAVEQVKAIDVNMVNMLSHQSFIGVLSLIAWGLGYFGQPHILVRFMAARSIKVIPRACRISLIWMIFCLGGAVSVGFFGSAYFAAHPDQATLVTENHERVFIVLSQVLFNPWIGGILMAAILAAVMSTLSCQLLVCSSTLTQDFYRGFIRPKANQWELLWFGRMMVLLISFVAIFIAMDPQSLVLSLVSYAWAGFGAAFGPVILISLWWKRMNKYGAMAGMFTGAATVLIWHQFNWFGLYEIVPGFLFAAIAIYVVSLLTEAPDNEIAKPLTRLKPKSSGLNTIWRKNSTPDRRGRWCPSTRPPLVLQGILPRRFGLKREYYFFVTPPAPTSSRRQPERIPIKNKLAETIANAKETS